MKLPIVLVMADEWMSVSYVNMCRAWDHHKKPNAVRLT